MNVHFYNEVGQFLEDVGGVLESREDVTSLMLGICRSLQAGRTFGDESPFFAAADEGGMVLAAAVRTPPHNVILYSDEQCLDAIDAIAGELHGRGMALPGAHGTVAVSDRFATCWSRLCGSKAEVTMSQQIYRLDAVTLPRAVSGRLRLALPADARRLTEWGRAFHAEASPNHPERDTGETVKRLTASKSLYVWDDEGPVSMAGYSRPTGNGIAISLVYTPAEHRGRGYASNCVAAVSQRLLDAGYAFCTLFTDLANPTSNKIYRAVGYRPLAEFREMAFRSGESTTSAN